MGIAVTDADQWRGGLVRLERPDGRVLFVDACPVPNAARDVFREAKLVLRIYDPECEYEPSEQALRRLLGLTAAEARLATALAAGRSLEEHAGQAGIAIGTARTQLKSVFAKTGTSRQAQLVALLMRLPPTVSGR